MTDWSAFFPFVLPFVRGCGEDTAIFAIRQAAIEFCARSQCWRQEVPITAVADQPVYTLTPPTGSVVSMLQSFTVLDASGTLISEPAVVNAQRGRSLDRNDRSGDYVFLSDDGATLTVVPTPDAGRQLVPYLTLKPSQAGTGIPDNLFDQHARAIADGALAQLLAMPHVAWRDLAKAQDARLSFLNACGNAAVVASRGRARSRQRSRGLFF